MSVEQQDCKSGNNNRSGEKAFVDGADIVIRGLSWGVWTLQSVARNILKIEMQLNPCRAGHGLLWVVGVKRYGLSVSHRRKNAQFGNRK